MNKNLSFIIVVGPIIAAMIALTAFMCFISHPIIWPVFVVICLATIFSKKPERHIVDLD